MSDVISINSSKIATNAGPLLVSRKQAQQMLGGISVSQLRRHIETGELQPVFLNASKTPQRSGKLYFRVADLEAFVEKHARRDVR